MLVFYEASRPGTTAILQGLEDGLRTSFRGNAQIAVEFVGSSPPAPADFPLKIADWMAYKYGQQKFDAIVAIELEPFHLAESLQEATLACSSYPPGDGCRGVSRQPPARSPYDTGCNRSDCQKIIRSALQMLPSTRRIALIGGAPEADRRVNKGIVKLIREPNPDLEIIDLTGLSLEETKARVGSLPDRTIAYIGSFYFDSDGKKITVPQLAEKLRPPQTLPCLAISTWA